MTALSVDNEDQPNDNHTRMRIGLLSDTHIPEVTKLLPPEITKAFRGVDLILHAGDIYIPSVLDDLQRIAPVLAAEGDDDWRKEILADDRVKRKHILEFDGQILWLVHERPYSRLTVSSETQYYTDRDAGDIPDIVVFGHEHEVVVERSHDVLFVNPGSPTFLRYCHGLGTVGILEIESGEATVRILQL